MAVIILVDKVVRLGVVMFVLGLHLIAVFVVTRFVVDIVAVIVVVTLVPLVRFVIMVVIVILVRNSAGLVSPGDQSSSQAELVVQQHSRREAQALYPVEISETETSRYHRQSKPTNAI